MRTIRLALAALFAVLAFSAIAAAGASAAEPLWLNGNESASLSFTGSGGAAVLRALNAGILGTINCEKSSVTGETLNKSARAVKAVFSFSGDCLETVGSTKEKCTEPIKTESTFIELGLLASGSKPSLSVLELVAPESGTKFVTVVCGSNSTTVEGAVVGEVPEENANKEAQYNSLRSELESVFASVGGNSENQKYRALELLGTPMTKAELKVSGFFGGAASQEGSGVTKPPANGKVELKY